MINYKFEFENFLIKALIPQLIEYTSKCNLPNTMQDYLIKVFMFGLNIFSVYNTT